jgi:hypothetical protein
MHTQNEEKRKKKGKFKDFNERSYVQLKMCPISPVFVALLTYYI